MHSHNVHLTQVTSKILQDTALSDVADCLAESAKCIHSDHVPAGSGTENSYITIDWVYFDSNFRLAAFSQNFVKSIFPNPLFP